MIQALGWLGSGLIVASLVHNRPVPFRLLNLASAIVLLVFNLAIGLWSMVVLNAVILIVNLWHLRALAGRRRPDSAPVTIQAIAVDPAPPDRVAPRPGSVDALCDGLGVRLRPRAESVSGRVAGRGSRVPD